MFDRANGLTGGTEFTHWRANLAANEENSKKKKFVDVFIYFYLPRHFRSTHADEKAAERGKREVISSMCWFSSIAVCVFYGREAVSFAGTYRCGSRPQYVRVVDVFACSFTFKTAAARREQCNRTEKDRRKNVIREGESGSEGKNERKVKERR